MLVYALAVSAFIAVIVMAVREHRQLRSSRRDLLTTCRDVFQNGEVHHGGDNFPRLTGEWHGHATDVQLIPDNMTIRRLPQLWLSISWQAPVPVDRVFAGLVRYSGYEFYAVTSRLNHRLVPPSGLPSEILICGKDEASQALLDDMREPLAVIFSDPRVKEVVVAPKGLRIVQQACEGRRGGHLLLRQLIFDDAHVSRDALLQSLNQLQALRETAFNIMGARAA